MNNQEQFWEDLKTGRFVSMVKESSQGQQLTNSREVFHIMKPMFAKEDDVEVMYCIFLNSKNRILAIESMFRGTVASAVVYPREVVKTCLKHKATAVIMCHNHPSGDPEPSLEDRYLTAKMALALSGIDATLHDHIIVGNDYYSMADEGWLSDMRRAFKSILNTPNETLKSKVPISQRTILANMFKPEKRRTS